MWRYWRARARRKLAYFAVAQRNKLIDIECRQTGHVVYADSNKGSLLTNGDVMIVEHESALANKIAAFVREGFTPHFGELGSNFEYEPLWTKLSSIRTELWLDTGDAEAAGELWTCDFTALTTNNTLLNREIQKGTYDKFIVEAAELLDQEPGLDEVQRKLELAFMLNARHALSLVERFDAYVSVEEHTDLAHDLQNAVRYAQRFYAICPERFIIKLPFTPAGVLATRKVSDMGIPVNHTLGFSARQNMVIASIGRPGFVNVFMGRLNSFVADNNLGDGSNVGERATLATQAVIRELRESRGLPTRLIGASLRDGDQVLALAGVDVLTMPPKVAHDFITLGIGVDEVADHTQDMPEAGVNAEAREIGVDVLWDVEDRLRDCLSALEQENMDAFSAEDLIAFFAGRGCSDVLVDWSAEQIEVSQKEGKIPKVKNWDTLLRKGVIGLDSLMNLGGLNSFIADQADMDRHVSDVIGETKR